jgi:hypothetical protein
VGPVRLIPSEARTRSAVVFASRCTVSSSPAIKERRRMSSRFASGKPSGYKKFSSSVRRERDR